MKNVLLFFMMTFLMFACTKNDEATPVLKSAPKLEGTLNCVNQNPLAGITVEAIDQNGVSFMATTNSLGIFEFNGIDTGDYQLTIHPASLYTYTQAEYDAILDDIWNVVLGRRAGTAVDLIAYHMIDFDNAITSYDAFLFEKLKDGERNMVDFIPWRLITSTDFNDGIYYASDTVSVKVGGNDTSIVDIMAVYIGDPTGAFCQ